MTERQCNEECMLFYACADKEAMQKKQAEELKAKEKETQNG
jgi:hypothetical protein